MNTSNSNITGYIVVPITIPYVEGDLVTHTSLNGYECDIDPDCPCHFERRAQEHEQSIRGQLAHEDEARREWFFTVGDEQA